MRKKVIFLILGIIIVLILVWIFTGRAKNNTVKEVLSASTVKRGDLLITVSGNGTLEAQKSLGILSKISGTVTFIVEEGKQVKEGEVLAKIDPSDYKNTYDQAYITYKNAEVSYEQAKLDYETQKRQLDQNLKDAQVTKDNALIEYKQAEKGLNRTQELFKKGVASQSDLDTAEATFEKAKNSYSQAEANYQLVKSNYNAELKNLDKNLEAAKLSLDKAKLELSNAKANLDNTVIKAPFSGIVSNVSVVVGDYISASTSLLTLLDAKNVELSLEVDETDIAKISVGLPVKVTLDAFPDDEFEGEVIRISPTAIISNNIPIFKVRVRIPNPDLKLKVGMSADGDIVLLERRDVLLLPLKAVKSTERRSYVEVLKQNGETELVRVTLGENDGINVIVESGLSEGDQVVLSSNSSANNTSGNAQIRIGIPGMGGPGR